MTHTTALSLPVFVTAKEHMKSKATTGRLPLASSTPKLFLRQPEHKWNVFSLLVCHAALHTLRTSLWSCVEGGEWNFVNYFIGDKDTA